MKARRDETKWRPHLIVRASAGSGKTFALSSRYLRLLAGGAAPESILAITFTRKAAGEVLGRVVKRLAEATASGEAAAKLAKQLHEPWLDRAAVAALLARLTAALHAVAVSTIDSFFNGLVRGFRYELGIAATNTILDPHDPAARQLRVQAIDAMLADDDLPTMVERLRRLQEEASPRSVSGALEEMIAELHEVYREAPDAAAWSAVAEPAVLDASSLALALEAMEAAGGHLPEHKKIAEAHAKNVGQARRGEWQALLETGIAGCIAEGKAEYYRKPLGDAVVQAYRAIVVHAKAELLGRIARRAQATHDLLQRFDVHDARLRHAAGVLLYSDLPLLLEQGLLGPGGEMPAELHYRIDRRVKHLLLDEFQDTSPRQWRVLRPLAQETRAHEAPVEPRSAPERSFFCVGDVKQAIYGWRGGSAKVFTQVEQDLHLGADHREEMARSYRCSPVVLRAVDAVCGRITAAPMLDDIAEAVAAWSQGYAGHTAAHEDQPGYVELEASVPPPARGRGGDDGEDDEEDSAVRPHVRYVAERVAQLAERYTGRTLGVLVRRNATVAAIIDVLRQLRVPASGEGGVPLTDDAAVSAALAALTLADHPTHTAAAFQVLHAPLGPVLGLTQFDGAAALRASRLVRAELATHGYAATLARWAEQMAPSCSARNVARMTQLVTLAEQYEAQRTLRTRPFVEQVRATRVEDPAAAGVRVMTVHQAKGLEFDAVVLGELEAKIGDLRPGGVWKVFDAEGRRVRAVVPWVGAKLRAALKDRCGVLKEAHDDEQSRRVGDDLSALYVSLTRPRYALHMIVPAVRASSKGEPCKPGYSDASGAAVARWALCPEGCDPLAERQVLWSEGDAAWHEKLAAPAAVAARDEDAAAMRVTLGGAGASAGATRSFARVSPSSLEEGGKVSAARLLALEEPTGMRRGTVLHACLSAVEWSDGGVVDVEAMRAAARTADPAFEEAWVQAAAAALQWPDVAAALARRGRAGVELWREKPFVVRVDGRLLRGVFDRVVIDRAAGVVELLDFKGERCSEAATERYRPQMRAYRAALAKLLAVEPAAVAAKLVFLSDGAVVDV